MSLCPIRQAGAIPFRAGQICLVTSTRSRRWVIPKGLIDPGRSAAETALQEAWEEAGLTGILCSSGPVGCFSYEKWGSSYNVAVFAMEVRSVADDWPECHLRQRAWVNLAEALARIDDEGLRKILLDMHWPG
jgi:8-oxo-dGTP pyrophosphatase MutT (NUDIX family)